MVRRLWDKRKILKLADRPHLESVFRELLSNEGNEIFLKTAGELGLQKELTIREALFSTRRWMNAFTWPKMTV